ncbi:MAG TPA: histidine kinase [Janthinobacterium sp.]|nr:histidine kinase [Janthinobacterium sp.]
MSAVSMDEIVKQIHDLPSLPVVVMELLASIGNDDFDLKQLAAKITLDQSLTAKTLRLANSSFYGMQSTVTSIRQAIAVLGFHSIRTLVTACSVSAAFTPAPGQRFDFTAFWRHSVATAVAAKALAPHLRQNPDTAFTAGLLHDLGTLVLVSRYPARYEEALAYRQSHDCGVAEAERAIFGVDHALVGGALAAHWKFPATIEYAVSGHHAPDSPETDGLQLTIHLANVLAHGLDLSGTEDDLAPALSHSAWRAFDLSDDAWLALFEEIEQAFRDVARILVR